jgi:adenylate cyclase
MDDKPASQVDIHTNGWSSTQTIKVLTGGQGRPAAIVVVVLITLFHVLWGDTVWKPVRNKVFDLWHRAYPRQVTRLPVTIVDIDDASLAAFGRWPWPRWRIADLVEGVWRLGAESVGLDMIMPEADQSVSALFGDKLDMSAELRQTLALLPSSDALLAGTMLWVPSVIVRVGRMERETEHKAPVRQTTMRVHKGVSISRVVAYTTHSFNVPAIEQVAFGYGYRNTTPDNDGVVRAMPLMVTIKGTPAPTFALELLRVSRGELLYFVYGDARGVSGIQLGDTFFPTYLDGRIHLYYSRTDPRRRLSARDILNGKVGVNALTDQIAIIGVTGVGITPVVATPVDPSMDRVEVHAQFIENLLDGTWLDRPSKMPWGELIIFLVTAVGLIALLPRMKPGYDGVLFLGALAVTGIISWLCFIQWKWLFDWSFPAVGNTIVLFVLLTAGFASADRRRRELRDQLVAERIETSRMAGELDAARDIQLSLLPAPETIAGLPDHIDFHAMLEPAFEAGGDLYDAFMLDANHLFFLVGDVSGKGLGTSLFMALSKALCKSTALREKWPLDALMNKVNEEISRENSKELFVTVCAGILDTRTGDLALCSAGHEVPILLRPGNPPSPLGAASGPPLCVLENYAYGVESERLQADDVLILITDGITEAEDSDNNLYGLDRALTYLAKIHADTNGQHHVEALCQGLYADVKTFVHGAHPSDDVTIMAIRFRAPQSC